jgi:hypothetical protein
MPTVRQHACHAHIPAASRTWPPRNWVMGFGGGLGLGHGTPPRIEFNYLRPPSKRYCSKLLTLRWGTAFLRTQRTKEIQRQHHRPEISAVAKRRQRTPGSALSGVRVFMECDQQKVAIACTACTHRRHPEVPAEGGPRRMATSAFASILRGSALRASHLRTTSVFVEAPAAFAGDDESELRHPHSAACRAGEGS